MPTPPTFQRPPRHPLELPKGDVEIPAPQPVPSRPQVSVLPVLLPGIFAVVALVVTLIVAQSSSIAAFLSFGFMGISSVTAFLNYSGHKKAYNKAVSERETKYRAALASRRQELVVLHAKEQQILNTNDPSPRECVARAERRPEPDRRLWERSPNDIDFLALRLGTGMQPLSATIKTPKSADQIEVDPLQTEGQTLAQQFATVPDAPICLLLSQAIIAGVAGPRAEALNTARALIMQLVTHHSPDEVKIVALFPPDEAATWDWLRWLPHVWTEDRSHRLLACEKDIAHKLLLSLFDLLNRRRVQNAVAKDAVAAVSLPRFVFIFADAQLAANEPIVPLLLASNVNLGAYSLFMADRIETLPKGCQAVAEVSGNQGRLLQSAPATMQTTFAPDVAALELADRLARAMAPVRLQQLSMVTEIPKTVPLLDLLGVKTIEELDVTARWQKSEPYRSLAVPVGKRAAGEPFTLDIHGGGQGPHGLVAGTTGSGKSEILQSLIASMAVNFHPHQVTFVLIDYKGGGMANAFREMPHLVGTITNLQGNIAMRALTALKSELHSRETILAQAGTTSINEYQRRYRSGQVSEPLPHLVIIADEFAELKTELPDFMVELVRAARLGRSLGVHLILATQKPAGVVSEEIWANSSFRICLRVERPEDSQEVLKQPDAAGLSKDTPGRAYFQVGANPLAEFQAAWGGAAYIPGGATGDLNEIVEVALDGSRRALRLSPKPLLIHATGTQLQALVAYLRDAAQGQGIQRLHGPWLPPLPEHVTLEQIRSAEGFNGQNWQPTKSWLEPVVGLLDDPAHQSQAPLPLSLGKDGHLVIYGAPGAGKTTLLQTMALSLALTYTPQDVNLYVLDFGGRTLTALASLPHVGGVILADENERLTRLLRFLLREMETRKASFARAGVSTLPAYRNVPGHTLPAIVVMLDNYTGFTDAYRDTAVEDQLAQIVREGGNLGIHLVLTATSPSVVKTKISGNITAALALRLADKSEYSMAVGRTGGIEPAANIGRGLIKGNPPLEFQTALPTAGTTEAERSAALKMLIEKLALACSGPCAAPIPMLPDHVNLCDLLPPKDTWSTPPADGSLPTPIGLEVDDLEPFLLDLNDGPHFLITGPVQAGKTTLLQSWLLALAEQYPPQRLRIYLADFGRGGLRPLARLPHAEGRYIRDDDQLGAVLAEIAQTMKNRRDLLEETRQAAGGVLDDERVWLAGHPAIVLAIDDFDALQASIQFGVKERLDQLIRRERGMGFHLLLAGASSDLNSSFDPWVKALKEAQTGFVLGSSDSTDLQLLNIKLPLNELGKSFPPGQGFYTRRGRHRKVKVATCQAGTTLLIPWVAQIQKRTTVRATEGGSR